VSIQIYYDIPQGIINTQNYDRIDIYRSTTEQFGYVLFDSIASKTSQGVWVTTYNDVTPDGSQYLYYLIKFHDTTNNLDTQYFLTFFPLTPREMRWVSWLKGWLPQIMLSDTSDETYRTAIKYALNNFNVYPPETDFTVDTFPSNYESLLIMSAMITFCMYKYLGIGIKDFNYSDSGLSLTIDRGEKIKNALDDTLKVYNELLKLAKLNFMNMGVGLGTNTMPIGTNMGRNILGILDIYQSFGR